MRTFKPESNNRMHALRAFYCHEYHFYKNTTGLLPIVFFFSYRIPYHKLSLFCIGCTCKQKCSGQSRRKHDTETGILPANDTGGCSQPAYRSKAGTFCAGGGTQAFGKRRKPVAGGGKKVGAAKLFRAVKRSVNLCAARSSAYFRAAWRIQRRGNYCIRRLFECCGRRFTGGKSPAGAGFLKAADAAACSRD